MTMLWVVIVPVAIIALTAIVCAIACGDDDDGGD